MAKKDYKSPKMVEVKVETEGDVLGVGTKSGGSVCTNEDEAD